MARKILVPVDVSETDLTIRLIREVERECIHADDEVHFLTVTPVTPHAPLLAEDIFRKRHKRNICNPSR